MNRSRTCFVRLDGADMPAGASRTIQPAIDLTCGLGLNGLDVTIDFANGTWTKALALRERGAAGGCQYQRYEFFGQHDGQTL